MERNNKLTQGELRQKQILLKEKKEKLKKKKEEELRDKYYWFADRKICPKCGNDLKEVLEVYCGIPQIYNGFFHKHWFAIHTFYIKCINCEFNFSTMNDDAIEKVRNYYRRLNSPSVKKKWYMFGFGYNRKNKKKGIDFYED